MEVSSDTKLVLRRVAQSCLAGCLIAFLLGLGLSFHGYQSLKDWLAEPDPASSTSPTSVPPLTPASPLTPEPAVSPSLTPSPVAHEEDSPFAPQETATPQANAPAPAPERPSSTSLLWRSNLPKALPGPARRIESDPQLSALRRQIENFPTATGWRELAERSVALGDYAGTAHAYQKEAEIYRLSGDRQAALVEEGKAARYATDLQLYHGSPATGGSATGAARLEPARGCYVGAFIDRDHGIETFMIESQIHGKIEQFNDLVRKPHASFFMYRRYGMPFPTNWARYVAKQGAIPHIAWEPQKLSDVQDDDYLRAFMNEAALLDHPVMLRFASEMNGGWTRYNGDPEEYVRAFRTVYQASRRAPKVALMWCPNTVPVSTMHDYYPGDDFVDWVGVNFYSVPYLDNDPNRPGDLIHPTTHLQEVYERYARRKPMAIGEWAASRRSSLTEQDLTEFATRRMAQLYASLPLRFPRVKMVNWYDCNNIEVAKEERQLNNFNLTQSPRMLQAYRRAVARPHFLGAGQTDSGWEFQPLEGSLVKARAGDSVLLFAKSYDPELKVYFKTGGEVVHASDDPLQWRLPCDTVTSGSVVKVLVYDSKDRFVSRTSFVVEKVKE